APRIPREDELRIRDEQALVAARGRARDGALELAPEVGSGRGDAEGAEPDRQRPEERSEAGLVDARDDARGGKLVVGREGQGRPGLGPDPASRPHRSVAGSRRSRFFAIKTIAARPVAAETICDVEIAPPNQTPRTSSPRKTSTTERRTA